MNIILKHQSWPIAKFIEYDKNPRKNDHAVDKIAQAINFFGFRIPIVAKSDGTVVDGHLRLKAARQLGMTKIPVVLADDMTDEQIKAFRISVNRMAELADWDEELLHAELLDLSAIEFDMSLLNIDFNPQDFVDNDDDQANNEIQQESGEKPEKKILDMSIKIPFFIEISKSAVKHFKQIKKDHQLTTDSETFTLLIDTYLEAKNVETLLRWIFNQPDPPALRPKLV